MSTLIDYLSQKRAAILARREKNVAGELPVQHLKARVTAEGRSGIRHIRIREYHILSDSPYDFAGYNLGPGSPELQLGVLGSCLTHIFLIQAADKGIPLEELEVEVTGQQDPRSQLPGNHHILIYPHNINYTVYIKSSASPEELADLHETVERVCPIFNLLREPQTIIGKLIQTNQSSESAVNHTLPQPL
ncbi:MAG: OsmC family protein [Caldilineaceae bacterium]|nr:OsmC family protein [Caldilineaceae bacterium]